jgi:hypothetical protein
LRPPGRITRTFTGGSQAAASTDTRVSQDSGSPQSQSTTNPGPEIRRSIQDPGPAIDQVAGQSYDTPFVIAFARPEWGSIRLEDGLIQTFKYCSDDIKRDGSKYTLRCRPASDHRVPILIQGFKQISISSNETALDDKLEFGGFRTPYPPAWGRSSTDYVEVPGGRLADVFGSSYSAIQGVPGTTTACVDKTKPVSVAAIIHQNLEFPEPPCRRYDVVFDGGTAGPSTRISSGCLAGAEQPVPVQNKRATCWYSRQQGASFQLNFDLFPGFKLVPRQVTSDMISSGAVALTFTSVAPNLMPTWPYGSASPSENSSRSGAAPRYLPESVEYFGGGGASCGSSLPVPTAGQENFQLPSVADAGCSFVPTKAKIVFKQVPTSTDDPPSQAFLPSYPDEYVIASGRPGDRDASSLKVQLPVAFNAADAGDYNNKFGTGAQNSSWPGVVVFSGDCSRQVDGQFVKFGERKDGFRWPLKAAVFDGKGDEPLTACAPARISKDGDKPYFTFKLQGTRAVGPRRVIVIANSQNFAKVPGTVPALQDALAKLVDAAYDAYTNNAAPLSPITVYSVDSEENYNLLFTGEQAALKRDEIKRKISEHLDRAATPTPDFLSFAHQPEVKDIEKVIFVMDGSVISQNNQAQLALMVNRLNRGNNPNNLVFYLTSSSCEKWITDVQPFGCNQLAPSPAARKDALTKEFVALVTPSAAPSPAAGSNPR